MGLLNPPKDKEVVFSDITDNDSSTNKHGYIAKLSGDPDEFYNGQGQWAVPEGGVLPEGSAYIIIGGSASPSTNGASLVDAYNNHAKVSTPNGSALASGNRYTIFLLPGIYDLGGTTLTLDTYFIDIVGLSSNTGQTVFGAGIVNEGNTVILSTIAPITIDSIADSGAHDLEISNVCLKSNSNTNDSAITTAQTGFGSKLKVTNVLLRKVGGGNRITPWDKNFSGTWTDVRAWDTSRAFGVAVSGTITVNGTFTRCKANGLSFGYADSNNSTISGTFVDCEADGGGWSHGGGVSTLSGFFVRCRYVASSGTTSGMFGGTTGVLSGRFEDCLAKGGEAAWGAFDMTGVMLGCGGAAPSWDVTLISGVVNGCEFKGNIE